MPDIGSAARDSPDFRAMTPTGTVPVLKDGANPPLWETSVILRYLAIRHGAAPFWPDDLTDPTEAGRWAEGSKVKIALGFTAPVFWRVVRTAAPERDPVVIARALAALEDKLRIAEDRLTRHRHLAGDAFALADIRFGHIHNRSYDIGIARTRLPICAATTIPALPPALRSASMSWSATTISGRDTAMPYEWLNEDKTGRAELHLWPYRSLPRKGFVAFIAVTATLLALPLVVLLGTTILWGLLPFLAAAVGGMWWALSRSYRAGELVEVLTLAADRVALVRRAPGGAEQSWEARIPIGSRSGSTRRAGRCRTT